MFTVDTSDLVALSRDLGKTGRKVTPTMVKVFTEAGVDLRDQWRENATATAGEHGKHYPKSITHELKVSTSIVVEIGPDKALPQGGMSFEYGSVNQPPHLDGQRAADSEIPKIDRRVDSALGHLGL